MKVLITGSHGFVGTWFRKWFSQNRPEDTVVCIDLVHPTCPWSAEAFFAEYEMRYDLVIHLAATVGGRATIDGKPMSVAHNFITDAALFEWVERTKPGCTVYFSSSAAYPIKLQGRNRIETPQRLCEWMINLRDKREADMTYGHAKLTGEYLAQFVREAGHRVMVFRPFSGYAHDQKDDYPWTAIAKRAVARQHPLEVWGSGDQVRDFIHIDDVVRAVMAAYEDGFEGTSNLCTGIGTSFITLAQAMAFEVGYLPLIYPLKDKPSGVHRRVGDPHLMQTFYTPQISLEEGIRLTIKELQ